MIHSLGRTGKLVIFSDVHVGAEHHAEKQFSEALRWCKENDCSIFLNGDLIENSIVDGKAPGEKLLEQRLMPTAQVLEFVRLLKPFAKRGRVLGVTRGNHEARSRREAMIDLCEIIAAHLEVPYYRIGGYVRVKHGSHLYAGGIHHGHSAGKNIWLELDKMANLYPESDFVACGHNHALDARTVTSIGISGEGTERVNQRWQVRTGTYLGFSEYARELVLPPSAVGSPVVSFGSRVRTVDVDVRTLRWIV